MNTHPVRLAAGLALIALCALAEESPDAKMAEPQTKPATAREIPPYEVGLIDKPVQLPTQVVDVDELRRHMKQVNQELKEALQREARARPHAFYEKALTKDTAVDLLSILLVTQQMMDHQADPFPLTHDHAFLSPEEDSKRTVTLPILRSAW
jgi:hypothetical protein